MLRRERERRQEEEQERKIHLCTPFFLWFTHLSGRRFFATSLAWRSRLPSFLLLLVLFTPSFFSCPSIPPSFHFLLFLLPFVSHWLVSFTSSLIIYSCSVFFLIFQVYVFLSKLACSYLRFLNDDFLISSSLNHFLSFSFSCSFTYLIFYICFCFFTFPLSSLTHCSSNVMELYF